MKCENYWCWLHIWWKLVFNTVVDSNFTCRSHFLFLSVLIILNLHSMSCAFRLSASSESQGPRCSDRSLVVIKAAQEDRFTFNVYSFPISAHCTLDHWKLLDVQDFTEHMQPDTTETRHRGRQSSEFACLTWTAKGNQHRKEGAYKLKRRGV